MRPHRNCAEMLLQHLQYSNTFQFICIQDSLKNILTAESYVRKLYLSKRPEPQETDVIEFVSPFLISISQESRKQLFLSCHRNMMFVSGVVFGP